MVYDDTYCIFFCTSFVEQWIVVLVSVSQCLLSRFQFGNCNGFFLFVGSYLADLLYGSCIDVINHGAIEL